MWSNWIVVAMAAASCAYALRAQGDTDQVVDGGRQAMLADSMALYRTAVLQYAHLNPSYSGRVADAALALPSWYTAPVAGLWSNQIGADGLVTVYATKQPDIDITADLARLAQGSLLAGRADLTAKTIVTAGAGPYASLPSLGTNTIVDGAPVWLGRRF